LIKEPNVGKGLIGLSAEVIPVEFQSNYKMRLLEAADKAEKKAVNVSESSVKDTMLALADLYRDMAAQIEQLDILRTCATISESH
jgi:hypothetical protein